MLVPTDFVGAIIGKKGQTIQSIQLSTQVLKIDIHGRDSSGLMEKVCTRVVERINIITR